MKIEILGVGCATCNKLYEHALEAVKLSGKQTEVIKVDDFQKIMNYGVLSTSALVVDGDVKSTVKVPKIEQIKEWIK